MYRVEDRGGLIYRLDMACNNNDQHLNKSNSVFPCASCPTYPALIHRCLALLAGLVQLVVAPLPVSVLCLVQVATGAGDSPHLDRNNTQPAHFMLMMSLNLDVQCDLPMIPTGFTGLYIRAVVRNESFFLMM